MKGSGKRITTTALAIWSVLWPGGATAFAQARQGAQNPPAAQQNAAEDLVEWERETPFGTQRGRIPRSEAIRQGIKYKEIGAGTGATAPATGTTPVVVAPAPAAPPLNVPAQIAPQTPAPPAAPAAAPSQAAARPAAPTEDNPTVPIALHLENAELSQVIGIIASELKMNYIVDASVKGSVNINTLGEVHRADLFPLLQMILRINGATAVQTGSFFRIVPLKDVQRIPIDPIYNPDESSLSADDRISMNIIPLKYVSAPDMTKILTPFLSEGGHLFSHDAGNILIVTESSRAMKRLLELIAMFDSEAFTNQRARLYQIKNSEAKKMADELRDIFAAYGMSSSSPAVRFVPIERINSILAVSGNAGVYPEVEKWLEKLDHPQQSAGVRSFVYKVENAKAVDLASVLMQLMGIQGNVQAVAALTPGAGAGAPGGMAGAVAASAAQMTSVKLALPGSGTTAENSHIRIVPDAINNQLVVLATAQEYEQIKETLKDLDIPPRQVMIEAKVYEVDLSGALSAGVSAYLQKRDGSNRQFLGSFASAAGSSAAALTGNVGALIGKTRQLMLFLNAAEARSQARVISAPSLLASDNLAANINVGTQIPVLTSQALVPGGQAQGTSLFTNTIQNVDTGVILSITPRINSSGLVNLNIQQEVSSPLAPTGSIQSPSIQKRSITTQAVVQDGETIALGGIIQENRQVSKNRVPLLGDIPYFGLLFGSTSVSTQKTELIIMITPTVIRNGGEAQLATNEFRSKLKDLQSVMEDAEKEDRERKEQLARETKKDDPAP